MAPPWTTVKVADLEEGLWVLLGWNMGTSNVASLIWGLSQLHNATSMKRRGWEGWSMLLAKVEGLTALDGPGVFGTVVAVEEG